MNILKPRKSVLNARAIVYRRVLHIGKSRMNSIVYRYTNGTYTYLYRYNFENGRMERYTSGTYENPQYIDMEDSCVLYNGTKYFIYHTAVKVWTLSTTLPRDYSSLLDAGYNDIGKYHTNQYYSVGSIDYHITGDVSTGETQPLKGNITPIVAMNIKYYDDSINLRTEDLIVIDNTLYSVESVDFSIKHQPRPYKVYYATLNSIL